MFYSFDQDLFDFVESEPAEKDDGGIHPTLHTFFLPIHKLDLSADDDEVQLSALHMVHPLEDVVKQHWPTLLH